MVTGRVPFDEATSQSAVMFLILRRQMPVLENEPLFDRFPELSAVTQRCWDEDEAARSTIQECLDTMKSLVVWQVTSPYAFDPDN